MDSWVADIFGYCEYEIIISIRLSECASNVLHNASFVVAKQMHQAHQARYDQTTKTQRTVKCLFTLEILYLSHSHASHHMNGCSLQNDDNKFYLLRHGCGRWNRSATKLKQSVACIISPCTVPKNTVHHMFKHLVIYAVLFRWWLSLTKDLRSDIKFADFTS